VCHKLFAQAKMKRDQPQHRAGLGSGGAAGWSAGGSAGGSGGSGGGGSGSGSGSGSGATPLGQYTAQPNAKYIRFGSQASPVLYYFVKSTCPPSIERFDAFTVLSVPTSEMSIESALMGEKLMHSVVLLVESTTGHGMMLEYLSNDFGCVSVTYGIVAAATVDKHPYGTLQYFNFVPAGFYSCPQISAKTVYEYANMFEGMCKFDLLDHNCHVFHRSFVSTLLKRKYLYNLRSPGQAAALKATTTSQIFHEIGSPFKTRDEVLANNYSKANTSVIHSFHLSDLMKSSSKPVEVHFINYLPNSQTIIQSDFGTISATASYRLNKSSENFQTALSSGNKSLLRTAIRDCERNKLTSLAEAGGSVFGCLSALDDASTHNDKGAMKRALAQAKAIDDKLQALNITGGLTAFESYVKAIDMQSGLANEVKEAKKLLNWSLLNGNMDLLGAATESCQKHNLQEEYERGSKAMELVAELTKAWESNSKVSMLAALEAAEPFRDIVCNFWVYKKCSLATKDDSSVVAVSYRNRRLVIVLAIVVAAIVYGLFNK
jgi:hypothetical protein